MSAGKSQGMCGLQPRTKCKACPEGPTGSMNIGRGGLTKDPGVRAGSVLALSST